jgi:hypothetical protein
MKDTAYVVCMAKSDENYHEDNYIKNCHECGVKVVLSRETKNQVEKVGKSKVNFICKDCFIKLPKFGKIERPDHETMQKIRETYPDMDEVGIRNILNKVRNREF